MSKESTGIQVLPASTTTTLVDSASLHFKVNYEQVKHLGIDEVVSSEVVSVGQHLHEFTIMGDPGYLDDWGWHRFVERTVLEENYVIEGHITFVCTIMVTRDTPVTVPPSDIGNHLGCLLDQAYGTDVSFTVDGETFPANRALVAARSPVFKAELFGSMVEATMSSITLQDITPPFEDLVLVEARRKPGESLLINAHRSIPYHLQELTTSS